MAGLDRRIILHMEAEGHRGEQGRYVPGAVTDVELWAQVQDGGESDILVGSALTTASRAVFTIRWRDDIARHAVNLLTLTYEGAIFNVETLKDYDARRRFLALAAVGGHYAEVG